MKKMSPRVRNVIQKPKVTAFVYGNSAFYGYVIMRSIMSFKPPIPGTGEVRRNFFQYEEAGELTGIIALCQYLQNPCQVAIYYTRDIVKELYDHIDDTEYYPQNRLHKWWIERMRPLKKWHTIKLYKVSDPDNHKVISAIKYKISNMTVKIREQKKKQIKQEKNIDKAILDKIIQKLGYNPFEEEAQ